MKRLELKPNGFPCNLEECPNGYFLFNNEVCFKTEYYTNTKCDAYCSSGEYFWGGTIDPEVRAKLIVTPLVVEWVEG